MVSEHLLRPAVEPVLAVVFAQILYPLPQPLSNEVPAERALVSQIQAQRALVDYERANKEGRTAPSLLPGDFEEILVSVLEFR